MDLSNYQIKINESYPQIENAEPDINTVNILKALAFSRTGELSGVLTYVYQSNIADRTDSDLGELFEEIAITEMMHLNMLMHAISEFGGTPKYESAGAYFNASCVNYTTKLKEMLENNIQAEQGAIADYTEAIKRVKNESLKSLFARIIKDEELHLNAFKNLRDTVQFLSI